MPSLVKLNGSVGTTVHGKPADNNDDDMVEVKNLLNRIAPEEGGTSADPLNLDDNDIPGDEFFKLVRAIEQFQIRQDLFGGRFDGRVDPNETTLRHLNLIVNRPPRKGQKFQEVVPAR